MTCTAFVASSLKCSSFRGAQPKMSRRSSGARYSGMSLSVVCLALALRKYHWHCLGEGQTQHWSVVSHRLGSWLPRHEESSRRYTLYMMQERAIDKGDCQDKYGWMKLVIQYVEEAKSGAG